MIRKDFKAIITILNERQENALTMNKNIVNRNTRTQKKNQMEVLELKNTIFEIKIHRVDLTSVKSNRGRCQ